jgi:hypothetical protein
VELMVWAELVSQDIAAIIELSRRYAMAVHAAPQRRQCTRQAQHRKGFADHRQRRTPQRDACVPGHPAGGDEHEALHQFGKLVSELHRDAANQ